MISSTVIIQFPWSTWLSRSSPICVLFLSTWGISTILWLLNSSHQPRISIHPLGSFPIPTWLNVSHSDSAVIQSHMSDWLTGVKEFFSSLGNRVVHSVCWLTDYSSSTRTQLPSSHIIIYVVGWLTGGSLFVSLESKKPASRAAVGGRDGK